MDHVNIGYFGNIEWDNTLHVDGEKEGLLRLEQVIHAVAENEVASAALHELPFINAYKGVELFACHMVHDIGVSGNG